MLGEDKHRGEPHWWLPQSTSLPFYQIRNEHYNIGAWSKRVNHSTHELSSGKLELRVADIGESEEEKEKEKICDRREESRKKINYQDFFYIYYLKG